MCIRDRGIRLFHPLLIRYCNYNVKFRRFSGAIPQTSILGVGYSAPSRTSPYNPHCWPQVCHHYLSVCLLLFLVYRVLWALLPDSQNGVIPVIYEPYVTTALYLSLACNVLRIVCTRGTDAKNNGRCKPFTFYIFSFTFLCDYTYIRVYYLVCGRQMDKYFDAVWHSGWTILCE